MFSSARMTVSRFSVLSAGFGVISGRGAAEGNQLVKKSLRGVEKQLQI